MLVGQVIAGQVIAGQVIAGQASQRAFLDTYISIELC
jgi:hypothetical protein